MAPLVGPTWPILMTSSLGGGAAAGAADAAGAAATGAGASSFLPHAASSTAAEATTDRVNLFMKGIPVKKRSTQDDTGSTSRSGIRVSESCFLPGGRRSADQPTDQDADCGWCRMTQPRAS